MPVQHSPPPAAKPAATASPILRQPTLVLSQTKARPTSDRSNSIPSALEANPRRPPTTRSIARQSLPAEPKGDLLKNRKSHFGKTFKPTTKKERWLNQDQDPLSTQLPSSPNPRRSPADEITVDHISTSSPRPKLKDSPPILPGFLKPPQFHQLYQSPPPPPLPQGPLNGTTQAMTI